MDFTAFFDNEFPHEFLDRMIRGLPGVYRAAKEASFGDHPIEQARDLFPHNLRSLVDEHMLETAGRFETVEAVNKLNDAKNSNHVEVWTDSVVLTASRVVSHGQFVRRSNFREALASSNQLNLFPELCPRPQGNIVYGIIVHGYHEESRDRVGFVFLGIPDDDYCRYVFAQDLLDYYTIDLYPTFRAETIEDAAEPRIKVSGRVKGERS
jgi:hypothetical protein